MGRPWIFRASVAANVLLVTYVVLNATTYEDLSLSQQSLSTSKAALVSQPSDHDPLSNPNNVVNPDDNPSNSNNNNNNNNNVVNGRVISGPEGVVWDGDDSALGEGIPADLLMSPDTPKESENNGSNTSSDSGRVVDNVLIVPKLFPCDDLTPRRYYGQRGAYWVLYNYIMAEKSFRCDQSITYTTHADFSFLDNLEPLLSRWQGPVSLSMYAPGTDFDETVKRILYLRECQSSLIKDLVTFHIFFDTRSVPRHKIERDPFAHLPINCSAQPPPTFGEDVVTYKKTKKLPYPVNVARNVAREMATTHYILPSDIELYPNPNLIPDFLDMIRQNDSLLQRPNPKVFVLSIFEVEENIEQLPTDKAELVQNLRDKVAIPFHKYVCANCHRIPKADEWLASPYVPGMRVFHVGKRHKPFQHWEPIFIGTKFDPMYDERLSWEGRSDKMTQGYVLCVLDYEFHILDNAFLIHRPGIKRNKIIPKKNPVVAKQNALISKVILPELRLVYGSRPGCVV